MKFSIRQLLIVTVQLAILIATFSALFKLKQTRIQIASEQERVAETQAITKQRQVASNQLEGTVLRRTIERDILKRIADPVKNQQHLDSIRSRMTSEFKARNDQITLIQLPSFDGWSYLISVPEGWNAMLNFGTNEKPTGTSQHQQVKPPYDQFAQTTLAAGIHSLEVSVTDREKSDAHDLEVFLDRTKVVDFVWSLISKGASSISSSKSNGHISIDRQLLKRGHRIIECNGQKDGGNSGSWKIWLSDGKDDASAPKDQ
ncbi:MAG: hypothetical protein U0930_15800 [Pirellulales bacterium]